MEIIFQVCELDDNKSRLKQILTEQEKSKRMQEMLHEKNNKDVTQFKQQLNHERNLKLNAFQRVDDLQTCVSHITRIIYLEFYSRKAWN